MISAAVTFVVEDCCECGVAFAMTKELRDRRIQDHKRFYCPNGHHMVFTGKTEEQKLREQLEAEQARRERGEIQRDPARAETERQKRKAAAARGQLTKARNRAARGVCPAAGCKRSFTDMHAHVASCHPELLEAVE